MNGEKKIQSLRFWFFTMTSLFLVVTFVLYLPLWFQHQAGEDVHGEEMMGMMGHDEEGVHGKDVYHEESDVAEGLLVNFNISSAPVSVGSTTRLDFFVNQKPVGLEKSAARPVPVENLEIEHTKLMHVIGVRSDMEEFFHIHPESSATTTGLLDVEWVFAQPGLYKVWSEVKQRGIVHSFGHPEFRVAGDGEQYRKDVFFGRNAIAGNYQVSLRLQEPVRAGQETELEFDVHTIIGDEVELEEYLAAPIHLTIIKDDWTRFIHTHPEDGGGDHHGTLRMVHEAFAHGDEDIPGAMHDDSGGADETVNFHVAFPDPGLYRTFAQFRPRGIDLPPDEALTVSFWLRVEEAPKFAPTRGLLVFVSIILILILSGIVKKYLTVRI